MQSASVATRTPEEVFVERLRGIPEGQAKLYAERAGVSEQTLSKWKTGAIKPNPKLATLARLARVLQLASPAAMITDQGADPPATIPGFLTVPRRHAQIGAGPGFVDELDEPKNYAFTEDWLKRMGFSRPAQDPARLGVFKVSSAYGSSMEPTIRPGAVLLADLGQGGEGHRKPHDGRIYVVREDGGGLQVKRVRQPRRSEELIVWGDNAREAPPESWPLKGRDVRAVLVGEVRWIGQEVA